MHPSSLENMEKCHRRYIAGGSLDGNGAATVLDVGGSNINGSYRDVFTAPFRYQAADVEAGPDVDVVLDDPYHLPFEDRSIDIVVSGQAFEHTEFFWQSFAEMARVLKTDGFIFLIVPSAGPVHRYPVDCYRFYPDALAALAKYVGCVLVDSWLDDRGPWNDLVGVFRHADAAPVDKRRSRASAPAPWRGPFGSEDEEVLGGNVSYLDVLDRIHREVRPAHYLEIGVYYGESLALARGPATGVDPDPAIDRHVEPTTDIFPLTSDEFFETCGDAFKTDFAFIDGMHRFEFALRDFMNIERRAGPGAFVAVHDTYPNHPKQAERTRQTAAWTGDVWRFADLLGRHRPDLFLLSLDAWPTGLLLIAGLDPANRVLWTNYNPFVRQAQATTGPPESILRRHGALDPAGPRFAAFLAALKASRDAGASPADTAANLRHACG